MAGLDRQPAIRADNLIRTPNASPRKRSRQSGRVSWAPANALKPLGESPKRGNNFIDWQAQLTVRCLVGLAIDCTAVRRLISVPAIERTTAGPQSEPRAEQAGKRQENVNTIVPHNRRSEFFDYPAHS